MKNKLHIIVTGEEGRAKSFVISKTKLKTYIHFTFITIATLSLLSIASVNLFMKGNELESSLSRLETDLKSTKNENSSLKEKVTILDQEKEILLNNAVSDLRNKSKMIESALSQVGVKIKQVNDKDNSGGPFTSLSEQNPEDILFIAEKYLETFNYIPLGAPVQGKISSGFGRRVDPINGKPAFHEGVDIKGKRGSTILATAAGKVIRRGYDKGYGWYVIIDHGNDFRTRYCHLKKITVKHKQLVERGDTIGLLGNSGRSTGPHVHYEIHKNEKLINPIKFIRIASHLN